MKRAEPSHSMTLTHQQAQELLQKRFQARLESFERDALEGHLASCADCSAYAANARGLDQHLAVSLPKRWPEPRYTAVELQRRQASVQTRLRRKTMLKNFSSFARLAGAAALLLLVIAGLSWMALRGTPRPQVGGGLPNTATPLPPPTLAPTQTQTPAPKETPSTAAPTITPVEDAFTNYTVKDGDTCSGIAFRNNIALDSLIQLNGLTPSCEIYVGQELRIPRPTATPPAPGSGRIDLGEAERLVIQYVFNTQPGTSKDIKFPLQELTTDEIWQRMRAQVFKVSEGAQEYQSYTIINGQVYPIGESFGGMGVHTLLVTDLNADSAPELVYAYSFGSGIHQSSIGMLRRIEDGSYGTFVISDFRYFGELRLEKQDDATVKVTGVPDSGGGEQALGRLMLLGTQLVIAPGDAALIEFTSLEHGIGFLYPETWQANPDQYFKLGVEELDDGEGNLERACEWEANRPEKPYGAQPVLQMASLGSREACLIASEAGAAQPRWVIFFASGGRIHHLTADAAYAQVIAQSFRYLEPLSTPGPQAIDLTPRAPSLKTPDTRALGSLTLSEYAVVSAAEDTPTHFEYNARILDTIFPDRNAWSNDSMQDTIERTNRLLERFGYRIEERKDSSNNRMDLYKDGALFRGGLSMFYPPNIYSEPGTLGARTADDFAMVIEDGEYKAWLVRKNAIEPYNLMNSRYTRPVIVKNNLISVQRGDTSGGADRVDVLANGEKIFTYTLAPSPVEESVKTLDEWNGNWVLEIDGTLLVSGENWNQQMRADEIFNWTRIEGAPFFFFRRDGKIHAWYDGKELPLGYDEMIHYRCCEPAAFNVVNSPVALWFHTRKTGMWYFVEITK